MFVLCVISPDHWLIVLLILSDYWPAAPTRGWCWGPVFSVMVVTTTSTKNPYSSLGPAPGKADYGRGEGREGLRRKVESDFLNEEKRQSI